jgi:hypothetical protein
MTPGHAEAHSQLAHIRIMHPRVHMIVQPVVQTLRSRKQAAR